MTTYHLRNNDGTEVFTGTISPAPGGGSQPGAVRVVGPFAFDFNDFAEIPADSGAFGYPLAGLEDHIAADDILVVAWIEATGFAWDSADPGQFELRIGVPGGDFMTLARATNPAGPVDYTYGVQINATADGGASTLVEQYRVVSLTDVVGWVAQNDTGVPNAGTGKAWLAVSTPVAP